MILRLSAENKTIVKNQKQELHLVQEDHYLTPPDSKSEEIELLQSTRQNFCVTLMGPFINTRHKPTIAITILQASKLLRFANWTIKIIPDDIQSYYDAQVDQRRTNIASVTKMAKIDQEFSYLSMNLDYESMEVKNPAGMSVAYINTLSNDEDEQWINVKCISPQTAQFIENQLRNDFLLAKIDHVERNLPFVRAGFELTSITDIECEELGTYFLLKQRNTNEIVAKAHCSYQNTDAESPGPILDLIETGQEWRGKGFGISLLNAIEDFYRKIFANILNTEEDVRLYICNIKSHKTFEFLQERGFRDDDGLGEMLSKSLNEETAAEEAPYVIRQCMGRTLGGEQCQVTSEDKSPVADSLCFGRSKFCTKHQHQEYFPTQGKYVNALEE